jgi:hypothetical protein
VRSKTPFSQEGGVPCHASSTPCASALSVLKPAKNPVLVIGLILKMVAGRSFEALRQAIDAVVPEPSRRAVGAGALVHGLSHLIADNQLPQDLLADDEIDALIDNVLAIYRQGLAPDGS